MTAIPEFTVADYPFNVWLRRRGLPALGIALLLFASRTLAERNMWAHMLIQIPMLVGIGIWCADGSFGLAVRRWNGAGVPGLLLASSIVACWMVPRLLDAATERAIVDALKFGSLLLAGALGRSSWSAASVLVRSFFAGNAAWMTASIGMLLIDAPARLCVRYGSTDQLFTGYALIGVTAVAVVFALMRADLGGSSPTVDRAREEPSKELGSEATF